MPALVASRSDAADPPSCLMASVVVAPVEASTRARSGARVVLARLSSRVYVPACAIGALAAALVVVGWSADWGDASFAGSTGALRAVVIGPATLAVLGAIL